MPDHHFAAVTDDSRAVSDPRASLDKNAVITLQVKRGETTAFVTVSGLTEKG